MGVLANSNAIESGGYTIDNSLRFQSASSQYLSRTMAASATTNTWSAWVKLGSLTGRKTISGYTNLTNTSFEIKFENSAFQISEYVNGYRLRKVTTQVFRDPSAWYHVLFVLDTSKAIADDRVIIYINGIRVTSFSVSINPSLNLSTIFGSSLPISIGATSNDNSSYFDGYLAEYNFIDGQALTPADFGETNTDTGQWVAKKYTGTYGTNGFYLPFNDGTSTTTLGYDASGNANNWTLNNFTRSAGVNDCWMNDVPSGNGANYAVFNPLYSGLAGYANANLQATTSTVNAQPTTVFASSGKWYAEFVSTSGTASNTRFGFCNISGVGADLGGSANGWAYLGDGRLYNNASTTSYGVTYTTNDVLQIALDLDAGKVWYGKNGTWMASGVPSTGTNQSQTFTANQLMTFAIASGSGSIVYAANMGQRSFAYTPPTGFKALNTANLPEATIKQGNQHFDVNTWTGNGTSQTITNSGAMSPDFVWIKSRSVSGYYHVLIDAVRGITKALYSNATDAENTLATRITALNSNGFTLGSSGDVNDNAQTFVGWQWDAGSSTVTNTDGTISSQVRANPNAGFSVVTYSGSNTVGTVGHGLGVVPNMIIVKRRNSGTDGWQTYHSSLGNTKLLYLNSTQAAVTGVGTWQSTTPTTTKFYLEIGSGGVNASGGTYVAYCFSEIDGYSKFGSYIGNGSADGTFVYTGFRPKFLMFKTTTIIGHWVIVDTARNTYNVIDNSLYPDTSGSEINTITDVDFLSNGFKWRGVLANETNVNGQVYIYMAFAENPFANSNAR